MQEFDKIGEDLFNKIRGRFPEVTIGDENGTVTNEPTMARFFDFDYNGLGKVSVAIDDDEGLTIIYSKDFMKDQDEMTQDAWYDFLKELRIFSKKRMLDYSVRDITKSNLNKRDYKFLAKTPEEAQMTTESKLYGTSKISYQKVGEARIVIKHTESVNAEVAAGRTRNIGKIYIESADGERFIYPFKHLSGARAMARHVAEGGKPFDDFGTHIVGLSEEMSKLRKFSNYMGRSSVMAESLAGYVDVVKERIKTVKKTIESLQKPGYYAETFAAFETPIMEDVPADVAENWIDQLTIKQFNEELSDVFPYIYKLIGEATRVKSLGPADLEEAVAKIACTECDEVSTAAAWKKNNNFCPKCKTSNKGVAESREEFEPEQAFEDVAGPDKCWDGYKKAGTQPGTGKNKGKRVNKCVPEDIELEQGFEEMMGQFSEAEVGTVYMRFRERKTPQDETYLTAFAGFANSPEELQMDSASRKYMKLTRKEDIVKAVKDVKDDKIFVGARDITVFVDKPAMADKYAHLGEALTMLEQFGKKQGITVEYKEKDSNNPGEKGSGKKRLPKGHAASADKNYMPPESEQTKYFTIDNDRLMKFLKTKAPSIMNSFRPNLNQFVMDQKQYNQFRTWLQSEQTVQRFGQTKISVDKERSFSQDKGREFEGIEREEQQTPLGEFILSYFDKENGTFPKGETAVLTMVEKDYGEQFIDPAKAFIERIGAKFEEFQMRSQPQQMEAPDTGEYNRMRELAGLR